MVVAVLLAGYTVLVGYVYGDARRRGMRHVLWTWLAILIPNGIGIILYFILRDPLLAYCTTCGGATQPGFVYCPRCGAGVAPRLQAVPPGNASWLVPLRVLRNTIVSRTPLILWLQRQP